MTNLELINLNRYKLIAQGLEKPNFSDYVLFKQVEAQKKRKITNKFAFWSSISMILLDLTLIILTFALDLTKPLILFYLFMGGCYCYPAFARGFELDYKAKEYRTLFKRLKKDGYWELLCTKMEEYRNSEAYKIDKESELQYDFSLKRELADIAIEQAEKQKPLIKKLVKKYKKLGQNKTEEEVASEIAEQNNLF